MALQEHKCQFVAAAPVAVTMIITVNSCYASMCSVQQWHSNIQIIFDEILCALRKLSMKKVLNLYMKAYLAFYTSLLMN